MVQNIVSFPITPPQTGNGAQVSAPSSVSDVNSSGSAQSQAQSQSQTQTQAPNPQATPESQIRLIVQRDASTGEPVYMAVNRQTGEVIKQTPTKAVLEMQQAQSARAGAIIKTDV